MIVRNSFHRAHFEACEDYMVDMKDDDFFYRNGKKILEGKKKGQNTTAYYLIDETTKKRIISEINALLKEGKAGKRNVFILVADGESLQVARGTPPQIRGTALLARDVFGKLLEFVTKKKEMFLLTNHAEEEVGRQRFVPLFRQETGYAIAEKTVAVFFTAVNEFFFGLQEPSTM
jgi:hypothetical protein